MQYAELPSTINPDEAKIDAGQLRITPGVCELEPGIKDKYCNFIWAHITCNWYEIDEERVARNRRAIAENRIVVSSYTYQAEDGKAYPIAVTTDLSIPLDERETVIHRFYESPFPEGQEELDFINEQRPAPIFKTGDITFTRLAFDALADSRALNKYVDLHASGQYGEISEADEMDNIWSQIQGGHVMSCYPLELGNLVIRTDLGRDTFVMFDSEDHLSTDDPIDGRDTFLPF